MTTLAPIRQPARAARIARVDRAVVLFHALSDATRLAALDLLRGGERCVCELQDALGVAQSRLSFHLRVLKDAGLVADRRDGRWSYYRLRADALAEAHDLVVGFLPRGAGRPRAASDTAAADGSPTADARRIGCCR